MKSIRDMIVQPAKTVEESEKGFSRGLKNSAVSGAVLCFIIGVQLAAFGLITRLMLAFTVGIGIIIGLIGPAMSAVSVDPLIYFFGGKNYEQTYKCFAFLTPVSLTGSIIGVNLIGLPLTFFLQ